MATSILDEWEDLEKEYQELESLNTLYLKKQAEIVEYQNKISKQITHQRYRLGIICRILKQLEDTEKRIELESKIAKRESELRLVEDCLPKKSSKYLRVILGNIDVSFMSKEAKFSYKDDYEKFKLICIVVAFVLAVLNLAVRSRSLQALHIFFLVWYYATISIRESILKTNGSRIKGWWRFHHVLSTFASALILVWPESETWRLFRGQFYVYNIYASIIQYLQYKYQKGVLYRMKALGVRDTMDITSEGFHSWMWRGLAFLVPLLFMAYFFQLANALVLYNLSHNQGAPWHVFALSLTFFAFFVGNTTTTYVVVRDKFRNRLLNNNYKAIIKRLY